MTPTERELLQAAIDHYGIDNQLIKALEEMTELSHALFVWAKHVSRKREANVREEIADVRIMLDQLELLFGDTSDVRQQKLERLKKRMENK